MLINTHMFVIQLLHFHRSMVITNNGIEDPVTDKYTLYMCMWPTRLVLCLLALLQATATAADLQHWRKSSTCSDPPHANHIPEAEPKMFEFYIPDLGV